MKNDGMDVNISISHDVFSTPNSLNQINNELNQIQPWLWWEDHAVLRNMLIILAFIGILAIIWGVFKIILLTEKIYSPNRLSCSVF